MTTQANRRDQTAVILLGRSAIAAAPIGEMQRHVDRLHAIGTSGKTVFAFSEQGTPTFKDVFFDLLAEGWHDLLILPFMIPLEPNFAAWITRSIQRWQIESGFDWPVVRVGRSLSEPTDIDLLLAPMLSSALASCPISPSAKAATEGSIVSDRKYRVLVCNGAPCTQAGAAVIGAHLRKLQVELSLADRGEGMRSTRTSCLGPCALAPVVQIYPEGIFYGGMTEDGIERLVHEHLVGGRIVEDYAYRPGTGKQMLRPGPAPIVGGNQQTK